MNMFQGISMFDIIVALVVIWFLWSMVGPKFYYRYDTYIDIDANSETVWAAIDATSEGWHSASGIAMRSNEQPSDPTLIHILSTAAGPAKLTANRLLEYKHGSLISARIERLENTDFPLGKESYEACEIFEIGENATRCRLYGKVGIRDPFRGFGHATFVKHYASGLKYFCETGEQAKNPNQKNKALELFLLVAAIGVATWQFGSVAALFLIAILFIHELGHAVAFKLVGEEVYSIRLIPFFGAITSGSIPKTALRNVIVDLGGTSLSLLIIIMMLIAPFAMDWPISQIFDETNREFLYSPGAWIYIVAFAMIVINMFQLLPVGVLDGGRALEAMLSGLPRRLAGGAIAIIAGAVTFLMFEWEIWIAAIFSAIFLITAIIRIFRPVQLTYMPATFRSSIGISFLYFSNVAAYVFVGLAAAIVYVSQTSDNTGITPRELGMRIGQYIQANSSTADGEELIGDSAALEIRGSLSQ